MRIYMIRHSLTQANIESRYVGITDVPLCAEGIDKAKSLKPLSHVDRVYSSPMKRARETAEIIFPESSIIVENRLSEMDFGHFEGRNHKELKHDPVYMKWVDTGGRSACPGGEPPKKFARRVLDGMLDIVDMSRKTGEDDIYVVTHGGVIMSVLYQLVIGDHEMFDFMSKNCGGWFFEIDEKRFDIRNNILVPPVNKYRSFENTDEINGVDY